MFSASYFRRTVLRLSRLSCSLNAFFPLHSARISTLVATKRCFLPLSSMAGVLSTFCFVTYFRLHLNSRVNVLPCYNHPYSIAPSMEFRIILTQQMPTGSADFWRNLSSFDWFVYVLMYYFLFAHVSFLLIIYRSCGNRTHEDKFWRLVCGHRPTCGLE